MVSLAMGFLAGWRASSGTGHHYVRCRQRQPRNQATEGRDQRDTGRDRGIVVDKAGNIYFADSCLQRGPQDGYTRQHSTFAGGGNPAPWATEAPPPAPDLGFAGPHAGLAVDGAGNLYVADYGDSRIRKVDASGTI